MRDRLWSVQEGGQDGPPGADGRQCAVETTLAIASPANPLIFFCLMTWESSKRCRQQKSWKSVKSSPFASILAHQHGIPYNRLRVLDTAERSQVDQRIGHQLHAIVPLLDMFKSEQQPLEFIFPCKGPLDTHPQGMDGGVEQPLAPALGGLAVAGGLFDVGDHGRIHNNL